MKVVFVFIFLMIFTLMMRPACTDQAEISRDCALVCKDIGYAHDKAIKTGIFTYTCKCKRDGKTKVKPRA